MKKYALFASLFLGFLISSISVYAAKSRLIYWVNSETTLRNYINVDTYEWYAESTSGKWEKQGVVTHETGVFSDLPPSFENNFFQNKPNILLFTILGTGQIYEYNTVSQTVKRLDKTYYRGYNFGAVQFARNQKLYSFGGYGFWNDYHTMTYYDKERAEWEEIRPRNFGPKSINVRGFNGYCEQVDIFYSGGSVHEQHLEKLNYITFDDFYAYHFKTNTWELLGKLNEELLRDFSNDIFWTGSYFFQWAKDKLYVIDPVNNKLFKYEDSQKYFTTNAQYFVKGDTVFNYWNDKGNIERLSIKEVLHKATYIGPVYTRDSNFKNYLSAFAGFAGLLTLLIIYKRRKKKTLSIKLDAAEKKLLIALTAEGEGTNLSALAINEVLDLGTKSFDNQRRIRVNVINQINQKLKEQFGVVNAIERKSSEEDKRLNIYRLKPIVFAQVKAMLEA